MSLQRFHSRSRQRGTVLVIALLVVAITTALAIHFSERFGLSIKRTENRLINSQLQQYWYAIENAAMRVLLDDKQNNAGKILDHLGEDWSRKENLETARVLVQAELGDAVYLERLDIFDAQSRMDLNRLNTRAKNTSNSTNFAQRYTEEQKRFIRLLQTRKEASEPPLVSAAEAEQLMDAVLDWMDTNDNPEGTGGAETSYYLSKSPPYRAANQPFASVSELSLVQGFNERPELYREILPLLIVLPVDSNGAALSQGLNINTADLQLMRTINVTDDPAALDEIDALSLIDNRPVASGSLADANGLAIAGSGTPFEDVADLSADSDFSVIFPDQNNQPSLDGLTTGTDYFIVMAELKIADVSRLFFSLLERKEVSGSDRMAVVRRSSDGVF